MKITANVGYFPCVDPASFQLFCTVLLHYYLLEIVYAKVLFVAAT